MLTQTGPTLLPLRRHTTQSQTLDAETRGHSTRLTGRGSGRGSWRHHRGTLKTKQKKTTKLGPRHFPIHQWKFAGKEERRGEKKRSVRKGNTRM